MQNLLLFGILAVLFPPILIIFIPAAGFILLAWIDFIAKKINFMQIIIGLAVSVVLFAVIYDTYYYLIK